MSASSYRCGFAIISVAAVMAIFMAIVLAGTPARSEEKTEAGVPLEFWKGHFNRSAEAFHEWDKEKEIPPFVCAAMAPMAFRNIWRMGRIRRRPTSRMASHAPIAMATFSPTRAIGFPRSGFPAA